MSTFLNRNSYRRSRKSSLIAGFDPVLTGAVGGLLIIGTLLVYAATREWYSANGLDPQYYLKRHVINIVIGLALAWGTTIIDYRLLRAYTPFIWGFGVLGLLFVLIPGVGSEINGAKAWIRLPAGLQIQPAEIAKISIIIGISMLLSERTHNSDEPTNNDVLKALGVAAIPILLILAQPDMGTVFIISASVVTILAVSGASSRWVVGLILLAIIGGFVATKTGVINDYQIIFTVAGEEIGFLGSGLIIILLFIILMRGFSIARRSTDPYGTLVCTGVIAWFAFQIFENIGMTLGLMPMTGVPLPFMSYGGSSMFANLVGFGLLQNVHASHRS